MTFDATTVPALADDEVHLWRSAWLGGEGEGFFARLLAGYAGIAGMPAIIRGEHGKPVFPPPLDTLGFNWSHSGDVALLAVARGPAGFQIGVDVEVVRPRSRAMELARRFFAPEETAELNELADADRLGGFLSLWTAKEAVLKAHGGGLSYGLHRVSFRLAADGVVPRGFDGDVGPASDWQVRRLALGDDLVSTLAWRGGDRRIRVFTSSV